MTPPLAIVPVRDGRLAPGGLEAVGLAAGHVWLIGSGVDAASDELAGTLVIELRTSELHAFAPGALAAALSPLVADRAALILPGSPDGRDLAPLLAHELDRPYVSGALEVGTGSATVVTHGGRVEHDVTFEGPPVVTVQPGAHRADPHDGGVAQPHAVELTISGSSSVTIQAALPPDPTTMDLADADRIVAGGAGTGGPEAMRLLGRLGQAFGASLGATRVVTDAGWTDAERQIGTTGVEVEPDLYVAFGISGAVQHVMGLGPPNRVISVNVDPSCPMMAMADLAVVCDVPALLPVLADRLGIEP